MQRPGYTSLAVYYTVHVDGCGLNANVGVASLEPMPAQSSRGTGFLVHFTFSISMLFCTFNNS